MKEIDRPAAAPSCGTVFAVGKGIDIDLLSETSRCIFIAAAKSRAAFEWRNINPDYVRWYVE